VDTKFPPLKKKKKKKQCFGRNKLGVEGVLKKFFLYTFLAQEGRGTPNHTVPPSVENPNATTANNSSFCQLEVIFDTWDF